MTIATRPKRASMSGFGVFQKSNSFEPTPGAYAANSSIGSMIEGWSFSGLLTRI
jgi:hypothetical protein